jgi:periplasmic copper chaperone A
MKKILIAFMIPLLSLVSVSAQELPLKVEGAWMQAVPDSSSATAAYMTLTNLGKTPLELVGARTTVAERVEPMITTKSGSGLLGMERVPSLPIPAGGKLVLQPGGNHLMIMELKQHPSPGDKVKMTLLIDPGTRELELELLVSKQAIK